MSDASNRAVNTSDSDKETNRLNSCKAMDVNGVNNTQETPITPEEVARHIQAATDSLTGQLERLYNSITP